MTRNNQSRCGEATRKRTRAVPHARRSTSNMRRKDRGTGSREGDGVTGRRCMVWTAAPGGGHTAENEIRVYKEYLTSNVISPVSKVFFSYNFRCDLVTS